MTILLGIGGALVAKFLGQALGIYQEGQTAGLIGSTVGAIVILFASVPVCTYHRDVHTLIHREEPCPNR